VDHWEELADPPGRARIRVDCFDDASAPLR
jgi:hypothetical protein